MLNNIINTFKSDKLSKKEYVKFMSRFLLISIPLFIITMFINFYLFASFFIMFLGTLIIINLKRIKDTGRNVSSTFILYLLIWPLLIAHTIILLFSDFKKCEYEKADVSF